MGKINNTLDSLTWTMSAWRLQSKKYVIRKAGLSILWHIRVKARLCWTTN